MALHEIAAFAKTIMAGKAPAMMSRRATSETAQRVTTTVVPKPTRL
jgi:hypothetical protein